MVVIYTYTHRHLCSLVRKPSPHLFIIHLKRLQINYFKSRSISFSKKKRQRWGSSLGPPKRFVAVILQVALLGRNDFDCFWFLFFEVWFLIIDVLCNYPTRIKNLKLFLRYPAKIVLVSLVYHYVHYKIYYVT